MPVPLHGPLCIPFRAVGIRPSRMNPNTCTICELMFARVMKARNVEIDATVLFADLRGYTAASQIIDPDAMTCILDAFYDECADAIWEHDGLLNKTIGDAIMAIFNFPIRHYDHGAKAVRAALTMQRGWRTRRKELVANHAINENDLHIGIGISGGIVKFGEFGQAHRDLTAIGTVVNTAARAQSAAHAGQILVTATVRDQSKEENNILYGEARTYHLKGLVGPINLYNARERDDLQQ
jgi:adenylate cyclase